jgi:hypothetical protein
VHDLPPETNLILGSSMSLRLNEQILGPNYFKLAFGGGGILTGLEIIRLKDAHPPMVLIEVNQLGWYMDHELVHDLFSPWLSGLRNHSPIFKEEGRPANFVNGILEACVRHSCRWAARWSGRNQTESVSAVNPELFSQLMRMYTEYFATVPSELTENTKKVGDYVDALTSSGSLCVFYEMPIDSSLTNLQAPRAVREVAAARFPRNKYHWLQFARDHRYQTNDGIHLTQSEADRITATMAEQVNQINRLGKVRSAACTTPHRGSTRDGLAIRGGRSTSRLREQTEQSPSAIGLAVIVPGRE